MATEAGTQAIDRAAQLLVRVVESPQPLGVNELAERSGLPRSTTSRWRPAGRWMTADGDLLSDASGRSH